MKILAVADIHGMQYRLNTVLESVDSYSPDLLVICGDITQFGPGEVAKNILNQIPCKTLAIPGNIDTPDVERAIDESSATNLHLHQVTIDGIKFVGVNGVDSKKTMRFLTDESYKNIIQDVAVLVSHVPPHGFQDKVFSGMHSGSKTLRELIDSYVPRLVLCGHIHEDPGVTKNNGRYIVNCSIGKRGAGAFITLTDSINVKMIE